jgi:hypothetical protein
VIVDTDFRPADAVLAQLPVASCPVALTNALPALLKGCQGSHST